MIYKMYTMFDKCSGQYSQPIFALNDQMAKREFIRFCSDDKIAFMAADLQLYCCGSFDVESGKIEPCFEFVAGGGNGEEN